MAEEVKETKEAEKTDSDKIFDSPESRIRPCSFGFRGIFDCEMEMGYLDFD